MSKILTEKEMSEIVNKACNDIGIIDCQDSYMHFLEDLAELITTHFGGDHGEPSFAEDGLGYTVAFNINECVPDNGGIYKDYDTDVVWEDGIEKEALQGDSEGCVYE